MKELGLQGATTEVGSPGNKSAAKLPKLPAFLDGKDDLDSYHFIKCTVYWQSIGFYLRMSETAAVDYKQLKEAHLKRYGLTENGFRVRIRGGKPEDGESPEQFVTRLNR